MGTGAIMTNGMKTCADCGDEFDQRGLIRGAQWRNKCNHCNDFDDKKETIQAQTMSIVNGQMAESYKRMQAERKARCGEG
jgi:hypothetical protein